MSQKEWERTFWGHKLGEEKGEEQNEEKDEDEIAIPLRDFPEFTVDEVTISISDNVIKYSKPIMTVKGPGHLKPQFYGRMIKRIIYKKPTLSSKGYFTFEFDSRTNIKNDNQDLLYADLGNISDLIKVEFGIVYDADIKRFLRQIAEDTEVAIRML